MNRTALAAVAAGAVLLAVVISKGAKAAPPPPPGGDGVGCYTLSPGMRYYFKYEGPPKTFKAVLGKCWDVTYTIDVYDEDTDDWIPPADPTKNILYPGSLCAIEMQAECVLCGFRALGY